MTNELVDTVVAVTGGSGFIGRRVVDALHARGAEVAGFEADLLADDLGGWLDGASAVVHLAARSGGIAFQGTEHVDVFRENVTMTERVLRAAAATGVRRVFLASSGVVYSASAGELLDESAPTVRPERDAISGYAWSKLTDEQLGRWIASATGLEVVCGRFTNIYGPGGPFGVAGETVVHSLVRKAVAARAAGTDLEVWGDGSAVRDFLYVDDAAAGVLQALTTGAPCEVYNIAAGVSTSIADLAGSIQRIVAPDARLRFDASMPSGPAHRVLDASRLHRTGWAPQVDLEEGIRRTVRWWEQRLADGPSPPG